jgi:hypothetical protein
MKITGKVHCLFEQSGTFKNEFKKLGYEAEDYDIQNNFGETDYVVDLFEHIENGYDGLPSLFDNISDNDLVLAFFPCIYFETIQQTYYALTKHDMRKKTKQHQIECAIDRLDKRTYYHKLLYKLLWLAYERKFRLIIENPSTAPNYLITGQNFPTPTLVDNNRMMRGDVFKKPTAYWFVNCEPTIGYYSIQNDKEMKRIDRTKSSPQAGLCSEERSMIHPDYARNFICDFILGVEQGHTVPTLF